MIEQNFLRLKDKVVLITGGGSGIGLAIAEGFLKEGARVILSSRSQEKLDLAKGKLLATASMDSLDKSSIFTIPCDVTSDKDLKNLVNLIEQTYGKLNAVIAATGLYGAIGPFLKTPIEEWVRSVEINLIGTAKTVFYTSPLLSLNVPSQIILFSGGGQAAYENFSSYVTSKGGIWRFTETVGAELSKLNIFMNAVTPGPVNTQFLDDLIAAGPEKVGAVVYEKSLKQKKEGGQSPFKTLELCLYLLSGEAKGLYGKTLSAIWDPFLDFKDVHQLSQSDIYTFKRVVDNVGGTRPPPK